MKYIIAFAAGVLAGSGLTYIFLKEHFDNKAQEEIDSVIQAFRKENREEPDNTILDEPTDENKTPYTETTSIGDVYEINLRDYRGSFEAKSKEDEMLERAASTPYVISPAEVNYDIYDSMELIYYADGVLASPDDEKVEDIYGLVGNALNHFGDYEEDTVIVNNDRLKVCIEINRDQRNYSDVAGEKPPDKGGD